ncbi:MAG: HAMP domain-containing sensor histidine kinase [Eubacteriales bacterium]|nr:HAMP domain-containing sensor histidine kinase [Eubacteriales bacterium]
MNPKRYRSRGVKGMLLILAHAAAAAAAVCLFIILYLASTYHLHPLEDADCYEHTYYFSNLLFQDSLRISDYLNQEAQKEALTSMKDPVLDLRELREDWRPTFRNTSGLAYSLDTLKAWSRDGSIRTDLESDPAGDAIVVCQKPNGGYEYFYYSDFMTRIKSKDLTIVLSGQNSQAEVSDRLERIYQALSDSAMPEGLSLFDDPDSYVAGPDGSSMKYQDISSYQGIWLLNEKNYPPEGADSLLEVVNSSDYWNESLAGAFYALEEALELAGSDFDTGHDFSTYQEGATNLSYYFLDKTEDRILTNRAACRSMKPEEVLELAKKEGPYACLSDQASETGGLSTKDRILEEWQEARELMEERLWTDSYVFLLFVDSSYPVEDVYQEGALAYQKYASWPVRCAALILLSLIVFLLALVWLTAISGRRSQDEEIHLLFFDRWFAELFGAGLLALWLLPICALGIHLTNDLINTPRFSIPMALFLGLYTAFCFFLGYLSLVRRIKGKILWKNSCLHFALHLAKLAFQKAAALLAFLGRNIISKVKLTLACVFVLFLQFSLCSLIFNNMGEVFFLLFLLDLCLLGAVLVEADGRDRILDGLKRISGGELTFKIPLKRLYGDQKRMAEYINNIGDGLNAAVDKSLKNERMKTELITNVSHDLKTPLTSIINYVDLLKRENLTDPKICGYLDILEEKAQRLKSLTEDVVEASKASTGNITLEMTALDFTELLHQVLGEFEERFQDRRLTMVVNLDQEPSVIYADGRRLWRVLENVFGNAAKYSLEGTRVYVQVSHEKDNVCFSLKNISAQPLNFDAQELTQRFIRGDVSRSTEGSGLGLSIAKILTELMGGAFSLYLDGDLFKVTITFQRSSRPLPSSQGNTP